MPFPPTEEITALQISVWTYLSLEELCCLPISAYLLGVLRGCFVCDQEKVKLERTLHHTYCCLPPQIEKETHTDKEIENIQSALVAALKGHWSLCLSLDFFANQPPKKGISLKQEGSNLGALWKHLTS